MLNLTNMDWSEQNVTFTPHSPIGSSGLRIIKKGGGVELIMNMSWRIKNLSFLMLLDSIRLYY